MSTLKVNNITDLGDDAVTTSGVIAASALPAGSIIAVESVLKTDTFSASVTAGSSVAVTDLSITHTLANSANKLIFMAYFGQAGNGNNFGNTGIAIADDGTLIGIGDADGSRTRVGAGGRLTASGDPNVVAMPHIHLLYSPGDTASHTYTLNAINIEGTTQTVYINRIESTADDVPFPRGVSAITLMEVAG